MDDSLLRSSRLSSHSSSGRSREKASASQYASSPSSGPSLSDSAAAQIAALVTENVLLEKRLGGALEDLEAMHKRFDSLKAVLKTLASSRREVRSMSSAVSSSASSSKYKTTPARSRRKQFDVFDSEDEEDQEDEEEEQEEADYDEREDLDAEEAAREERIARDVDLNRFLRQQAKRVMSEMARLEVVEQDMNARIDAMDEVEREVSHLRLENSRLNSMVEENRRRYRETLAKLKAQLDRKELESEDLRRVASEAKSTRDSSNRSLADAMGQLAAAKETISAKQDFIHRLEHDFQMMVAKNAEMTRENQMLREDKIGAERKLEENSRNFDLLERENRQLREELLEVREAFQQLEDEAREVEADRNRIAKLYGLAERPSSSSSSSIKKRSSSSSTATKKRASSASRKR